MPDKKRERFYVDCLAACSLGLPDCAPLESERPDFVCGKAPRRVGVEITLFHLPPEHGRQPHQETQSLHDQIVDRAASLHARGGGPALYVSVHFSEFRRITKRSVLRIAKELADVVLRYPQPAGAVHPGVEVPLEDLPEEIAHIRVSGSIDDVDELWDADGGGWVAPVLPGHIQRELDRKQHVVAPARRQCDELWLVIVNDPFTGAAPVKLSDAARTNSYEHGFDRVLWLEPHGPRATELSAHHA